MENARKHSRKRDALLAALRATGEHPSAEMLYSALKEEYPDLSLGTVYRNLAMFVRDGDAVSVGVVNGQERYDACTYPHAHFVCTLCQSVLDVPLPDLAGLDEQVRTALDCDVEAHSLSFSGLCSRCRCNR